jgi:hypothetical protein
VRDIPLQEKFDVLCKIARAQHFAWRDAVGQLFPDTDTSEVVARMWEVTGAQTARAYARHIDTSRPVPPQVAECIGWSSLCMGEDVEITASADGSEGYVRHLDCPWFHWHKKLDLLDEDLKGCDTWFLSTIDALGKELGLRIRVETLEALPRGEACCSRRIWLEDKQD